jgi:hypothetical protein
MQPLFILFVAEFVSVVVSTLIVEQIQKGSQLQISQPSSSKHYRDLSYCLSFQLWTPVVF